MATNDVVRLDIFGASFGQEIINSFHFKYLNGSVNDSGLLTWWQTNLETEWRAIFENSYALNGYEARQVWPGPLDSQRGPAASSRNLQGSRTTGAGDYLAPWLATDVRVFADGRGRSRHGRFFPVVQKEADVVRDDLQPSIMTPLNAFCVKLLGLAGLSGTSTDYKYGIYSRKFAYLPGTHPPVFATGATVNDVWRAAVQITPTGLLSTMRSRRG